MKPFLICLMKMKLKRKGGYLNYIHARAIIAPQNVQIRGVVARFVIGMR